MAKKKSLAFGSVYYNKERKNWTASYNIIDAETKKEKRVRKTFPTETEAKHYLKSIQFKKQNEIFIRNNGIPLYELMTSIIENKYKTNRVGPNQYGKVLKLIDRIKNDGIGQKDICEITSEEIQEYFNSLTHYRNNYMLKFIEPFKETFYYAQAKGFLMQNPMISVYIPKSKLPNKKLRSLEIEEQQILTRYLKDQPITQVPFKNAFLIQIYGGLRIGEALALQDNDIDFKKNVIHINKTLAEDEHGKVYLKHFPKTSAGIRDVPIQQAILNELKEQKELSKKNFDYQLFVSTTSLNSYANPKGVNNMLKTIMKNICQVVDITTHCLRHTFGTRCIESGMSPVVVQRLMGHSDIRVTLNVYTSVLNKFKATELEKLNDYYKNEKMFNDSLTDDCER